MSCVDAKSALCFHLLLLEMSAAFHTVRKLIALHFGRLWPADCIMVPRPPNFWKHCKGWNDFPVPSLICRITEHSVAFECCFCVIKKPLWAQPQAQGCQCFNFMRLFISIITRDANYKSLLKEEKELFRRQLSMLTWKLLRSTPWCCVGWGVKSRNWNIKCLVKFVCQHSRCGIKIWSMAWWQASRESLDLSLSVAEAGWLDAAVIHIAVLKCPTELAMLTALTHLTRK